MASILSRGSFVSGDRAILFWVSSLSAVMPKTSVRRFHRCAMMNVSAALLKKRSNRKSGGVKVAGGRRTALSKVDKTGQLMAIHAKPTIRVKT